MGARGSGLMSGSAMERGSDGKELAGETGGIWSRENPLFPAHYQRG